MTVTVEPRLPLILTEVEAVNVERLSPSFVRVELGSPDLADFGVEGPLYDQRIKLIFPGDGGRLPSFRGADESWYAAWRDLPKEERGHMRTYTVRDVRGTGADTRVVVDLVLHTHPGAIGPGGAWAATARPGDRLVLAGPRRGEHFGGIEFAPADNRPLLIVGDETAVPAVCCILADLDADARGTVFLEVPETGDVLDAPAPPGIEQVWLPRHDTSLSRAPRGHRQIAAVRRHLGLPPDAVLATDVAASADLWETPTYSSSGGPIPAAPTAPPGDAGDPRDVYAWIAGECTVVTALRRALVRELGMDRRQVAFMGYWREGVAMRS